MKILELPEKIKKNLPSSSRVIKEAVIFIFIQMIVLSSNHAGIFSISKTNDNDAEASPMEIAQPLSAPVDEIINNSHISYRAMGGFTGVESYSVLITCVEGNISVLKTIFDPTAQQGQQKIRERDIMSKRAYMNLWNSLHKQNVFQVEDAPNPNQYLNDEFTYYFDVQAGAYKNNFSIYGLNRPAGARYFALKSLIDLASRMDSLWEQHHGLARK